MSSPRRHQPSSSLAFFLQPARSVGRKASVLADLCRVLARNGRWWLVPFVGVLGLTAVLLVVVSVLEYVAPFVYTVF